jgi:hypothetical protein
MKTLEKINRLSIPVLLEIRGGVGTSNTTSVTATRPSTEHPNGDTKITVTDENGNHAEKTDDLLV